MNKNETPETSETQAEETTVGLKLILNYIFNSYILYVNNGLINKLG